MDLIEYNNDTKIIRHPWETARFEVMKTLTKKYSPEDFHTSIADIGCGDIFTVQNLATLYPKSTFYAIDTAFTDNHIDSFKNDTQNYNITISRDINIIENDSKEFGLVLLMDVIEHIEDELTFLKDILSKDYISEKTMFFISVPAFQSLFTAHDEHLKHYRRYNRKNLIRLLEESGMEIIESGYFFTSLLKIRTLQKIKELIFGKKEQKGLAENNFTEKKANLLKSFLLLDFKITRFFQSLGIKFPGLSTYAICRKSAQ